MTKASIDEVEVLRFFETESLEKATVLFKIVSEKMRVRLQADNQEPPAPIGARRFKRSKAAGANSPDKTEEKGAIPVDSA